MLWAADVGRIVLPGGLRVHSSNLPSNLTAAVRYICWVPSTRSSKLQIMTSVLRITVLLSAGMLPASGEAL